MSKSTFLVKFTAYHYNSGKADNGYFDEERSFNTEVEATRFTNMLRACIRNKKAREAFHTFHVGWDGYISSVTGIFKIEESKI